MSGALPTGAESAPAGVVTCSGVARVASSLGMPVSPGGAMVWTDTVDGPAARQAPREIPRAIPIGAP